MEIKVINGQIGTAIMQTVNPKLTEQHIAPSETVKGFLQITCNAIPVIYEENVRQGQSVTIGAI